MSKAHGQLLEDCLLCLKVHGFNILDPGKVSFKEVSALKAGIVWKSNTGASQQGSRFVRFGVAGQSDILGFTRTGHFIGVECKVGKDILSEDQISFHHWLNGAGGLSIVARSYQDLDISLKHLELTKEETL